MGAVNYQAVITNTSSVTEGITSINDLIGGTSTTVCGSGDTPDLVGTTLAAGASATCTFSGTAPAAGSSSTDTVTVDVDQPTDTTNTATAN